VQAEDVRRIVAVDEVHDVGADVVRELCEERLGLLVGERTHAGRDAWGEEDVV
jgi:hypothetical protein